MTQPNEKFIVVEIQTAGDGTTSVLTDSFDNIDAAYNKYYTILAYAAISTIPVHAASIINNNGILWESKSFDHPILDNEE